MTLITECWVIFTIKNAASGIQILSTAPADGNSVTAGNSQEVTLSNIFNTLIQLP